MKRIDQWEAICAVAAHVGRKRPAISAYSIASKLDKLARIARTLYRLDVDRCNGTIGNSEWILDYAKADAAAARAEKRANAIGAELGLIVEHQTDPRGATIKVWADRIDGRLLACF